MPVNVWLSLLIPAFEYPLGVTRILDRMHASAASGIECLISDDSRSDDVELAVLAHPLHREGKVAYTRNRPALGAVHNWNELLSRASGEYVVLMHHDECPEHDDFFLRLRAVLAEPIATDVLILDCLLPCFDRQRLRRHMPICVKRQLVWWSASHLLRHNTVGPPSVVVARRELCGNFDTRLRWLVDVDWMRQIFLNAGARIKFSDELGVVSLHNGVESITAAIRQELPRLRRVEAAIVQAATSRIPVMRLLLPLGAGERLVAIGEQACWTLFRALVQLVGLATSRRAPEWLR